MDPYAELRPLLFSIAYRMLGSVAEAEDIVQDAFLRYHRVLREQDAQIESPKAYLSAVTTRLAIDHLRSARVRKETYIGEWLPEPLLTDADAPDGARHAEDADSLSMAFLLLLERLSPVERAVFLLHDVFDYGYDEVAAIVGKSAGQLPAARRAGAPARGRAQAALRGVAAAPGRARGALLRRGRATATSRASWISSPPTSSSTATAAARARRCRNPIFGRDRVARLHARDGPAHARGATARSS